METDALCAEVFALPTAEACVGWWMQRAPALELAGPEFRETLWRLLHAQVERLTPGAVPGAGAEYLVLALVLQGLRVDPSTGAPTPLGFFERLRWELVLRMEATTEGAPPEGGPVVAAATWSPSGDLGIALGRARVRVAASYVVPRWLLRAFPDLGTCLLGPVRKVLGELPEQLAVVDFETLHGLVFTAALAAVKPTGPCERCAGRGVVEVPPNGARRPCPLGCVAPRVEAPSRQARRALERRAGRG